MAKSAAKSKSILKKINGAVVDFEYESDGSQLRVDGEYVASVWVPFSEGSRKEAIALLETIRSCLDVMIEQQATLPLVAKT